MKLRKYAYKSGATTLHLVVWFCLLTDLTEILGIGIFWFQELLSKLIVDFKTDNITRSPKMPVINWSKKSCYNGPIENRGQTFDCLYFGHCALLFIVPIQWNLSVNTSHGNSKMWSLYTSSFWLNITENGLIREWIGGLCRQVLQ